MASIQDVAKLAGVSKSTVSLVINNSGYVSEATRQRVEEAIDALQYTPSRLAQGLSRSHSGLIAVIVPDCAHPYFSTLVRSIEQRLATHEYMTIVCSAKENEQTEQWYLQMLGRKIVDGVITAGHTIDLSSYETSARPIVSIDRYITEEIPMVQADHKEAALLAAKKLLEAGVRHVTHFAGTKGIAVQSDVFNETLTELLTAHGVTVQSVPIGHNTFHPEEYQAAARKLFSRQITTDAIVGVDLAVMACMQEANRQHISVPGQLKLLSYDGTSLTRLTTPVLTSVVQPIGKIGETAADLIVQRICGEKITMNRYLLPVTLQPGGTC